MPPKQEISDVDDERENSIEQADGVQAVETLPPETRQEHNATKGEYQGCQYISRGDASAPGGFCKRHPCWSSELYHQRHSDGKTADGNEVRVGDERHGQTKGYNPAPVARL